jgi:hypothetical protein
MDHYRFGIPKVRDLVIIESGHSLFDRAAIAMFTFFNRQAKREKQ